MKKLYFLLMALISGMASYAQIVPNGGMDTWRTNTSGTAPVETIQAPDSWFGTDSIVIALGEVYLMDTTFTPQLFQEGTIVNSAPYSAKVMTKYQDSTLGIFPGVLTNSVESVDVFALLLGGSLSSAVSFSGGTPVTLKITTVSAYVEYLPGIDTSTHMMGGADTGALNVEAHGFIHGVDTLLGSGFAQIVPGDGAFTQITATIVYTDTVDSVGLIRIFFASSGGGAAAALDSSTLYVDDVSMTGEAEPPPIVNAVPKVTLNDAVKVYPNPTTGTLYLNGPQNTALNCTLFSVSGQVVATRSFTGNELLDVSYLPSGLYFYSIVDQQGNTVLRGKVAVDR